MYDREEQKAQYIKAIKSYGDGSRQLYVSEQSMYEMDPVFTDGECAWTRTLGPRYGGHWHFENGKVDQPMEQLNYQLESKQEHKEYKRGGIQWTLSLEGLEWFISEADWRIDHCGVVRSESYRSEDEGYKEFTNAIAKFKRERDNARKMANELLVEQGFEPTHRIGATGRYGT
jgi:hypothetical protein